MNGSTLLYAYLRQNNRAILTWMGSATQHSGHEKWPVECPCSLHRPSARLLAMDASASSGQATRICLVVGLWLTTVREPVLQFCRSRPVPAALLHPREGVSSLWPSGRRFALDRCLPVDVPTGVSGLCPPSR